MADMVRPDPIVEVCHVLRMHVYKVINASSRAPAFSTDQAKLYIGGHQEGLILTLW